MANQVVGTVKERAGVAYFQSSQGLREDLRINPLAITHRTGTGAPRNGQQVKDRLGDLAVEVAGVAGSVAFGIRSNLPGID